MSHLSLTHSGSCAADDRKLIGDSVPEVNETAPGASESYASPPRHNEAAQNGKAAANNVQAESSFAEVDPTFLFQSELSSASRSTYLESMNLVVKMLKYQYLMVS